MVTDGAVSPTARPCSTTSWPPSTTRAVGSAPTPSSRTSNQRPRRARAGVDPLPRRGRRRFPRRASSPSGPVDPTVGRAMQVLGYDRDFADDQHLTDQPTASACPSPRPAGSAYGDRAARTRARSRPASSSISAPLRRRSPPTGPRAHRRRHRQRHDRQPRRRLRDRRSPPRPKAGSFGSPTVTTTITTCPPRPWSLRSGGSRHRAPPARRWARGGRPVHHVVDPATGLPAAEVWRTVSVGRGLVRRRKHREHRRDRPRRRRTGMARRCGLPARLVRPSGSVCGSATGRRGRQTRLNSHRAGADRGPMPLQEDLREQSEIAGRFAQVLERELGDEMSFSDRWSRRRRSWKLSRDDQVRIMLLSFSTDGAEGVPCARCRSSTSHKRSNRPPPTNLAESPQPRRSKPRPHKLAEVASLDSRDGPPREVDARGTDRVARGQTIAVFRSLASTMSWHACVLAMHATAGGRRRVRAVPMGHRRDLGPCGHAARARRRRDGCHRRARPLSEMTLRELLSTHARCGDRPRSRGRCAGRRAGERHVDCTR